MGDQSRVARIGDQAGDAIDDTDPTIREGQQRHAANGGDAAAIEGGADFLAAHAWQIEQKTGIVIHGGRGASCNGNGLVSATKSYYKSVTYAMSASTFSGHA